MRLKAEQAGRLSAFMYSAISLLAAATFLAVTLTTGNYTWVARLGGAAWVFLLSMIILMPTVTPWVRRLFNSEPKGVANVRPFQGRKPEVDPVCGMEVVPEKAAATSSHEGATYYFCALSCKEAFDKEPERYLQALEP